jgi:Fe-S oxidoreductase
VRVSLFVPCVVDQLTAQVGLATAKVLKRVGPKEL